MLRAPCSPPPARVLPPPRPSPNLPLAQYQPIPGSFPFSCADTVLAFIVPLLWFTVDSSLQSAPLAPLCLSVLWRLSLTFPPLQMSQSISLLP